MIRNLLYRRNSSTDIQQEKFQKLTPEKNIDSEKLKGYEEAIDYAISDKDIKNVALTGVYGSGKSSILESYKRKTTDKFIHISLSHFNKEELENQLDDTEEKILEGKILNQLLHQIDPKNVPQTIFKTKRKIKKRSILLITLFSLTAIISLITLFSFEPWLSFLKSLFMRIQSVIPFIPIFNKEMVDVIATTVLCCFFFYMMYKLIFAQMNRKFLKSFSIKGGVIESNIEVFSESKDSYFDKYLDDVLYLFSQSKAKVIVFEDIDRFNNEIIFEKLREINTLVNNKLISSKRLFPWTNSKIEKMTFIYLLRDDMFSSKDRSKFFDFIIPIVPVMTSTNSYEKLKQFLEESGIFENFDRHFLQKLSLYIDDMRLVKNIYNEFLVYSKRIDMKNLNLKNDELIAILAYKNLFPQDFSELLFNKGLVYSLFNKKKEYIQERIVEIEEDIETLKKQLKRAEEETISSIDELIYIHLPYIIRVDGKDRNDFSTSRDFIKEIRNSSSILVQERPNASWRSVTFDELNGQLEQNREFSNRKKAIEYKKNEETLKSQIIDLETDRSQLRSIKLKSIISKKQIEQVAEEKYSEIKKSEYFELVVFLIKNGYINEGYLDYINHFYENSLRISDKNFLRSIMDETPLPWDYSLTDNKEVKNEIVDRLTISDLMSIESLNFDLFHFLLTKFGQTDSDMIKSYIYTIRKYKKLEFLINFSLNYADNVQFELILSTFKYEKDLIYTIFTDENDQFTDQQLTQYLLLVLNILSSEQIDLLKNNAIFLTRFINNSKEFLSEIDSPDTNLFNNLKYLSPEIKRVNFSEIHTELAKFIFDGKFVEINFDNLQSMLEYFFSVTNEYDLKHKNFTIISELDDKSILEYVQLKDNINTYVEQYIQFSDEEIDDKLEIIYNLINNEYLDTDISNRYILCLSANNLELSKVEDIGNYKTIISNNKATPNEANILNYFESQNLEWTKELQNFIIENSSDFSFNKNMVNNYLDAPKRLTFFNKTLMNNSIPTEQYELIIKGMNFSIDNFEFENINVEKIEVLIKNEIIVFSGTSIQTFRDSYPDSLIQFILKNLNDYMSFISKEDNYDFDELFEVLLQSRHDSIEKQKELIDCFDENEEISIIQNDFEDEIAAYIMSTHFSPSDLEPLCERYDLESEIIQSEIYKILVKNLDEIVTKKIILSTKLINRVIRDKVIDINIRQLLLSRNIDNFEIKMLPSIFIELNLSKLETLFGRKEPVFEINEINENILNYLKKKNVISSIKQIETGLKVYNKRNRQNNDFID